MHEPTSCRRTLRWLTTLAILAPAVAHAAPIHAGAQARTQLPDLMVSGTRLAGQPFDQPYALYRVDRETLEARVGRTQLDRLNYGPGVFVQRTAPNQASPFIRGLTGEQSLLMFDGVRFSHAFMRPGPNQYAALVPDVSVSSVDAILGSSSVVNGSDGLTGALDHRLARAGRGVDVPHSAWLRTRVDTGNGGTIMGGVDGVDGDWAYSVEASASTFHDRVGGDDFRDHVFGEGVAAYDEIPNTAYDEVSAAARLAYFGLANRVLELSAGHTRQTDAPRPGGYFENAGDRTRLYRFFDPQTFSYLHLRDTWDTGGSTVTRLQTTLWWHRFGEEQFRSSLRDAGTDAESLRRRAYDDTLTAIGADVQATSPWGNDDQHELTWGATLIHETTDNAYRELRTPTGSTDPAAAMPFRPANWPNSTSVSDGSDYDSLGLFAQDLWQVTPGVSVLTGLRFSHYEWSFGDVDGDASDVTGALRGMWDMTASHRVFAGFSRGFRAPNLTNLDGLVDRGSSGQPAAGNSDLDPEISYTTEAGWKWRNDRDGFMVTVFNTEIDDLIQRDFAGSGEFTNVEGANLRGIESAWDYGILAGDADAMRLAVVGAVSLVDATRDIPVEGGGTVEDNISRANRLYGRIGLKVEPDRNWWGLLQVRWHDEYDDVATHPSDADAGDIRLTLAGSPDGSMPGYSIVDLMWGWQSDDGRRELSFFIENVADETYREPGSGADGVGRSIGVTAGVRI